LHSTLLKKRGVESKAMIQPFATKKTMADNSRKGETRSHQIGQSSRNKGSNGFYKRGAYRRGNNNDQNSL
jgi:hypothetical protein